MKLTQKQEAFATYLAEGKSQRDAYIKAYDCKRMKESSIDCNASKLANDPKIAQRCVEIRKEKTKSKITLKEEVFIQALVRGKSQRDAYKSAFSCDHWKPESIDAKASALFNTDKVQLRYKELYAEVVAEIKKDTVLTQEQVMQELSVIAGQQATDYLSWDDKKIVVKPSETIDSRAVKKISYDSNGNIVLEFYDKQKALEKLLDVYTKADQNTDTEITINLGAAAKYAE